MTEPKFTPPWSIEKTETNGTTIFSVLDADGCYIATQVVSEAYARFLAAAPEIYEILQLKCVLCKIRDHETLCKSCGVGAVLRKARGEEESK